MTDSPAIKIALDHIDAWSNHNWDKTKEMLAPDVHALVTSTQRDKGGNEFTGIDEYMTRKMKAAQLIEPGSVHILATVGDERNASILMTFRIGMGAHGAMVTMARSGLYLVDENGKIKDERDQFFILLGDEWGKR